MPIYEYLCGECGHELEALQKISEDALVFCPECGEKSLKKKVSAIAFRLKGTGWYETDFKNSGKKKPEDKGKDKKPEAKSKKDSTDGADATTGGKDAKSSKDTGKSKDTASSGKSSPSSTSD